MDRLQRMFGAAGGHGAGPPSDAPQVDTSEQIYISSLALLKMLKHGEGSPDFCGPFRAAGFHLLSSVLCEHCSV